jgi:hypothetical protein
VAKAWNGKGVEWCKVTIRVDDPTRQLKPLTVYYLDQGDVKKTEVISAEQSFEIPHPRSNRKISWIAEVTTAPPQVLSSG